jgi:excisionase family DNA binding protein/PAS domain S-box-containing protein
MTPPEHLLTVREVAAYLSCADETVKRLVRRGLLSAVRVGPRLRFRRQDVERYLAQRRPQAAPDGLLTAQPPPPEARSIEGEILYAIAVATAGEDRLERILEATLDELGRVIVFTGGSIALVEGDDLVIRAAVGPFADTALGLRQPRGAGLAWQVVTTGKPFLSHDVLADGLRPSSGFRSYLAVPLSWRGAKIGMLEVDSVAPQAFSAGDLALLVKVALALSGSVALARLYAAMQADVSARKQAELELKASHDQLAIILGGVADGITAQDRSGRLVYANDAAALASGYASAEALLATQPEPILHKYMMLDDSGAPFPLDQLPGRRALQGEANPSATIRFRPAEGGEERWAIVGARAVLDEAGTPQLAISIFRDVTAQKRAELHQRFLTAASAVLASSLDSLATLENLARLTVPTLGDWCVVDMLQDDGAIRPVAIAHADPSKAAIAWEMLRRYPVDPAAPYGTGHVLRTGEPELVPLVPDEVLRSVAHDEAHFALLRALGLHSTICVPLLIDGRAVGTIALVRSDPLQRYGADDLALAEELARRAAVALENAQLYARAERARELAEEALRQRDMFFSVAAHELRTPLTSLLGQAQLLQRRGAREGSLSERDQRSVEVVVSQAQRLNRLVLALLDLARIEQGRLSIDPAPLDLGALTRRVLGEIQPLMERYTLEASLPDRPLVVLGDELRLEQVLQNLIANGLRYSHEGSVVAVRLERNGESALLSVSDQGIGIPAEALPQLFQRFFRAENASAHHRSGLGIGLYVVKEIVALHGGAVAAESVEGQGTTFRVRLPLHSVA